MPDSRRVCAPCVKCFHSEEGATFPRRAPRVTGCSGLPCAGGGGCAGRRPAGGLRRLVPAPAPPGSRTRRSRGGGPGRCGGRSGTNRCPPPPSWSGRRGGWRPRYRTPGCRPPGERFLAGAAAARSNGGRAGWPVSTCRSAGRCGSASVCPRHPVSRTPTARRTASSPPCWAAAGRWGSGWPHTAAGTPSRASGWAPPSARCRRRCGDRVASRYGLPPAEAVEYRVVDDAPWSALHTYSGGHRSVVQVNAGAVLGAGRLPRLVAHEAYPGHHVECSRGEAAVAAGRVEPGVTVLGSPQTVVSEGLAECALGTAVGPRWGPMGVGRARAGRRVPRRSSSPSGSTPSWRCCGGCASTPRCCCTTTDRPRAGGSRPPRRTCGAGCCSTPDAPGASSTPSPARCGGRTSSPPSRARRSCGRGWTAARSPWREHRRLLDDPVVAGCAAQPNEYVA